MVVLAWLFIRVEGWVKAGVGLGLRLGLGLGLALGLGCGRKGSGTRLRRLVAM